MADCFVAAIWMSTKMPQSVGFSVVAAKLCRDWWEILGPTDENDKSQCNILTQLEVHNDHAPANFAPDHGVSVLWKFLNVEVGYPLDNQGNSLFLLSWSF